jgi:hypothetical protein
MNVVDLKTQLLQRQQEIKAEQSALEFELDRVNKELLSLMLGENTESFSANGKVARIVRPERVEYDWKGLEKALGKQFSAVLRPNSKALEELIGQGLVTPAQVSKFVLRRPSKVHIRVFNDGEEDA